MKLLRALGVVAIVALASLAGGSSAMATNDSSVVVCKYVGTPGVDETLQTGQNPIVVDAHALTGKGFAGTFPFAFQDAQGQSIAIRYATSAHDGDISECPGYVQPSEEPTPSVTPSVEPSPSSEPSSSPTATPSSQPSSTPSPTSTPTSSSTPTPTSLSTPPPTDTEQTTTYAPITDSPIYWGILGITVYLTVTRVLVALRRGRRR